jgi:hypothetical protein
MPIKNLETGEVKHWGFGDNRSAWPRCGAKTRAGGRCQQMPERNPKLPELPRNGRCRFHGGLSTGPRTLEGRRRVGDAARARYRAWADAGFPNLWPPAGEP